VTFSGVGEAFLLGPEMKFKELTPEEAMAENEHGVYLRGPIHDIKWRQKNHALGTVYEFKCTLKEFTELNEWITKDGVNAHVWFHGRHHIPGVMSFEGLIFLCHQGDELGQYLTWKALES